MKHSRQWGVISLSMLTSDCRLHRYHDIACQKAKRSFYMIFILILANQIIYSFTLRGFIDLLYQIEMSSKITFTFNIWYFYSLFMDLNLLHFKIQDWRFYSFIRRIICIRCEQKENLNIIVKVDPRKCQDTKYNNK
jgi:hypothetical protein